MEEAPNAFEIQKRKYFSRLAVQMRKALALHKKAELWKRKDGERDWGNVSEHCLVEVARTDVLAEKFGLSEDIRGGLKTAAALHDFFKKGERTITKEGGLNWDAFEKASQESTRQMHEAGFSESVVRLANSVGHGSLMETEKILQKEQFSSEDIAYLILHYVDDYTVGSEKAKPASKSPEGIELNDLDRRVTKNANNTDYGILNEEGQVHFGGLTAFEMQRRIGHVVEERLAALLRERAGQVVDPKGIPELVDAEINRRILRS